MLSQLSIAVNSYGKALGMLPKKGIRSYLLFPILVNILLLGLTIWVAVSYGNWLVDWLLGFFELPQNDWLQFLDVLLSIVSYILIFLLYFVFYKYLVLIVISPFLSFLSEKVEKEVNGREFPFSWKQLGQDVLRAIAINVRNFLFEILATIFLSLFAFIPLVGLLSPIAILIVQSYFFGFALMDYSAERYRMSRKQTEQWMRKHFWGVAGTGLVFHFSFLIPVVGWILAPIWGTVAGTLTFLELEDPDLPELHHNVSKSY